MTMAADIRGCVRDYGPRMRIRGRKRCVLEHTFFESSAVLTSATTTPPAPTPPNAKPTIATPPDATLPAAATLPAVMPPTALLCCDASRRDVMTWSLTAPKKGQLVCGK